MVFKVVITNDEKVINEGSKRILDNSMIHSFSLGKYQGYSIIPLVVLIHVYIPHGNTIVHSFQDTGHNVI